MFHRLNHQILDVNSRGIDAPSQRIHCLLKLILDHYSFNVDHGLSDRQKRVIAAWWKINRHWVELNSFRLDKAISQLHENVSNFSTMASTLFGFGNFYWNFVVRRAKRFFVARHQIRCNRIRNVVAFLENGIVTASRVKSKPDANVSVSVATCTTSFLKVFVWFACDWLERTFCVNAFSEKWHTSQMAATDFKWLKKRFVIEVNKIKCKAYVRITSRLL